MGAGLSRRMGQPKQWLLWDGVSLMERTLQIYEGLGPMVAVISPSLSLESMVKDYGGEVALNPHPEAGQGASIRIGVRRLLDLCEAQGILLQGILCAVIDQPLLQRSTIESLLEYFTTSRTEQDILIPLYGPHGERGNPVIFGRQWSQALQGIPGDQGGRWIIRGEGQDYVHFLPVDVNRLCHGGTDIDTQEDIMRLEREGATHETSHIDS